MATAKRPDLDQAAFIEHYTAVFGDGREWPDGSVVSVCHKGPSKDDPFCADAYPVGDAEGIWKQLERQAARGRHTWMSVGVMRGVSSGRGGKKDVVAMPALVVDIDTSDGHHHRAEQCPSRVQAAALVEALPFEPTLVIDSGGGLHVWGVLDDPLDPHVPEQAEVLARLEHWLKAYAREHGFKIDAGVTSDPARVLRPAGTLNAKGGELRSVWIESLDVFARTSIDDLRTRLSDVELPQRAVRRAASGTRQTSSAAAPGDVSSKLPGERFKHLLPISIVLDHLGYDRVSSREDGAGWGGGAISPEKWGDTFISDGGYEMLAIYSTRFSEAWGLHPGGDAAYLNSTSFLADVVCKNDFHAALAIMKTFPVTTDGDATALLDAFDAHLVVGDDGTIDGSALVAAATAATAAPGATGGTDSAQDSRPADGCVRFEDAEPTVDPTPRSMQELVDSGRHGTMRIHSRLEVNHAPGTPKHGIWRLRKDPATGDTRERVSSYLLWRPQVSTDLSVNTSGRSIPAGDDPLRADNFSVELIRDDGHRFRREGFTAEDSVNLRKVVAALNAGVAIPAAAADRHALEDVLRVLGHDSQDRAVRYTSAGWAKPYGETQYVYLAPAGSMTADGPTTRYVVGPPAGSTSGSLTTAQTQFGYPEVPESLEELRSAARAVRSFLAVTPKRPAVAAALLGALFAAPLHLSRRTTVVLTAKPETGKSLLSDALQSFMAATSVGANTFPIGFADSSPVGATVALSWFRHALVVADDYRLSENPRQNEKASSVYRIVVQSCYASAPQMKGTQAGGQRVAPEPLTTGVITCETLPPEQALVTRSVVVPLEPGDMPLGDFAPVGDFISDYAATGVARLMMADYVRWLAVRINGLDRGLASLRQEADSRHRKLMAGHAKRAAETVQVLHTGWDYALEWAEDRGISALLPSAAEVESYMKTLRELNSEQHVQRGPGQAILQAIADAISGGVGHVLSSTGRAPRNPQAYGWRRTLSSSQFSEPWEPANRGLILGHLNSEEDKVFVPKSALRSAAAHGGLGAFSSEQLVQYLAPLVTPGTRAGVPAKRSLGFQGHWKGFCFDLKDLFGDSHTESESETHSNGAALSPTSRSDSADGDDDDF